MFVKAVEKVPLWNAGYVELWDFSKANCCQEAREEAVAIVSSACRGKEIRDRKKHYQKMLVEHSGKPSEVLSFIPILTDLDNPHTYGNQFHRFCFVDDSEKVYTNLRAMLKPNQLHKILNHDCKQFAVFKIKVPYMIVDHLRRHKLLEFALAENWQSNRSKHEIEYFQNDEVYVTYPQGSYEFSEDFVVEPYIMRNSKNTRQELINKGEFGLRYVTGWIAGWVNDPLAWDNFLSVRTIKPSQKETIELAIEIEKLIKKYF